MSSLWSELQNAGIFAWLVLLLTLLNLPVAVLALGVALARGKSSLGAIAASVALWLAALTGGLGAAGSWLVKGQIDEVFGYDGLTMKDLETIAGEGYGEARSISLIALLAVALPLLLALTAAVLSMAQKELSAQARARRRLACGISLAAATVGVLASVAGVVSFEPERGRAMMRQRLRKEVALLIEQPLCDPCPHLARVIEHLGAEPLERDVPGVQERARKCIDDRLKALEAESPEARDQLVACPRFDEAGDPVENDLPAPPVIEIDRQTELEQLLSSPLLLDPAQRDRIAELLAHLKEATEKEMAKPEGAPSGKAPRGSVSTSAGVSGGSVANAARVVARMRGRFRACYQAGLASNPDMEGSVTLTAKIGPNGEVQSVGGGGSGDLAPIVPCLKAVVSGGGFAPPEGGGAVVTIPISFVRQP